MKEAIITPELASQIQGIIADVDEFLVFVKQLQAGLKETDPGWARCDSLRLRAAWLRSSGYKAATTINAGLAVAGAPGRRVPLDGKSLAAGEHEEVEL